MEIDRHFIKEKLSSGVICIPFVKSSDQVADILTKGIGSQPFHIALGKLGMRDMFEPACGGVLRVLFLLVRVLSIISY